VRGVEPLGKRSWITGQRRSKRRQSSKRRSDSAFSHAGWARCFVYSSSSYESTFTFLLNRANA
jgi:hypothetical protein